MKWNAFNLIEPSINRTKDLLFPVNIKYWIKLWFVSIFSSFSGGMGRSSFNSNFSSPTTTKKAANFTGNAISNDGLLTGSFIGAIIFIGAIFWLIFNYIGSMFTFINIEALVNKEFSIGKGWNKNRDKGRSFFKYKIVIAIINIFVALIIISPILFDVSRVGLTSYFNSFSILSFLARFWWVLVLEIIWVLAISIFNLFVVNFAVPHMYNNNIGIKDAMGAVFSKMKMQKGESFIYWLAVIVTGMIVAVASIFMILVYGIVAVLIGLAIFFGIFFISKIMAIVITVLFAIFALFVFMVILLPLSVFRAYLALFSYEKLMSTKILKKIK